MEKEHTHTHLYTHTHIHIHINTNPTVPVERCPVPVHKLSVLIIDRLFIYLFIVMTYDFFRSFLGAFSRRISKKKKKMKQNAQKNEQQITIEILQVFVVTPTAPPPAPINNTTPMTNARHSLLFILLYPIGKKQTLS